MRPVIRPKSNLVAVIYNGTAVLGLCNIGAVASKPVMEGKAVLFKEFSGVDCFDIEINETDPEKLTDLICKLEPTFDAIIFALANPTPEIMPEVICAAGPGA